MLRLAEFAGHAQLCSHVRSMISLPLHPLLATVWLAKMAGASIASHASADT
jgi:hypothetical protein